MIPLGVVSSTVTPQVGGLPFSFLGLDLQEGLNLEKDFNFGAPAEGRKAVVFTHEVDGAAPTTSVTVGEYSTIGVGPGVFIGEIPTGTTMTVSADSYTNHLRGMGVFVVYGETAAPYYNGENRTILYPVETICDTGGFTLCCMAALNPIGFTETITPAGFTIHDKSSVAGYYSHSVPGDQSFRMDRDWSWVTLVTFEPALT